MSEHTPGPWHFDGENADIEGPGGGCVCWVQKHGNVNTIAREREFFSHADARLIAAAPGMLTAIRSFLNEPTIAAIIRSAEQRDAAFTEEERDSIEAVARLARIMVAKATGKEPAAS